jgi:heptosyltransferase-2
MKIAVRAPNWIGDSVLALPAIESLSRNFPAAHIWIITKAWVKDIFTSLDFIHGVHLLPDQSNWKSIRQAAKQLNRMDFDTSLLLTNSFGSALLFYMAKIPHRWGYSRDGRQPLLTKRVSRETGDKTYHHVYYYLNLISGLGLKPCSPRLALSVTKEEKQWAKSFLAASNIRPDKRLFVINPGAYYGSAKRWPVLKYGPLVTAIQEKFDAEILIIGSSQELALAESIADSVKKKPNILAGKTTLQQLISILSLADLCVTNDSGPMHIANALGVPIVVLFGPTDPAITGPFQKPSVYIKKDVPCWPCAYRECPFDHRCMMNISHEEVIEACEQMLS